MGADLDFMRRAIALAAAQVGRTAENPAVGCVVVAAGRIVGEGATQDGGRPHAEEVALAAAGEAARGGVAYVTLEPCGARSSGAASCSERLVAAGVARVVIACEDPSTFAAGQGSERLRGAGVAVELGLLSDEAQGLYSGYRPAQG
ncbi:MULTISPECIES: deaminase [Phenylobacterium]|uniref:Deaminase n=1 Tax=Phenylobacterium conjunctum TaxID=1298959 RepID=A0ABW3SX21_9CAUL